jgi:metal-responsive CopG/Arc/MetJ family transcriptional regulator
MTRSAAMSKSPASRRQNNARPVSSRANRKERVLVEFPAVLLRRADQAARNLETNRSDLIRNAVERLLDVMDSREFEHELAQAYAANADMNRALAKEFAAVDREGLL